MNERYNPSSADEGTGSAGIMPSCVPLLRPGVSAPGLAEPAILSSRKSMNGCSTHRRDAAIARDALFTVWRDNILHVVSGSYFYKTEPYYSILRYELEGIPVRPSSASVLDAYVVPVCLERAHLAGIPVCEWGISQGYTPLPAILYGLNYFATASDYAVVRDNDRAKEVVKHITNKGKYPFCYQKLEEGAEIGSCVAVFGKTSGTCRHAEDLAKHVYDLFALPLVTLVYVRSGDGIRLSSLSPVKYSQMSEGERALLSAHISGQEFL